MQAACTSLGQVLLHASQCARVLSGQATPDLAVGHRQAYPQAPLITTDPPCAQLQASRRAQEGVSMACPTTTTASWAARNAIMTFSGALLKPRTGHGGGSMVIAGDWGHSDSCQVANQGLPRHPVEERMGVLGPLVNGRQQYKAGEHPFPAAWQEPPAMPGMSCCQLSLVPSSEWPNSSFYKVSLSPLPSMSLTSPHPTCMWLTAVWRPNVGLRRQSVMAQLCESLGAEPAGQPSTEQALAHLPVKGSWQGTTMVPGMLENSDIT